MSTKRKFHIPSDAEDSAITRAAESDPDNPPITDAEFKRMKPAREALPALVGDKVAGELLKRRGRRPLPADERKVPTTLRLDPDVLDAFKATGDGWQTRANDALRAWAKSHRMLPSR
jgi:uncharacterized protein (DUF4415 family)